MCTNNEHHKVEFANQCWQEAGRTKHNMAKMKIMNVALWRHTLIGENNLMVTL